MDSRESAFWVRFKAKRWAYTFTILATLTVGILIGTVISYGVKGKEGQKSSSDATPPNHPCSATALECLFPDFEAARTKRSEHQY